MIKEVIKRNKNVVPFNINKMYNAVDKAIEQTDSELLDDAVDIVELAIINIEKEGSEKVSVERIQDAIEKSLMKHGLYNVAKCYILYRDKQARDRMPDIFKKRINLKPYEYPNLYEYVDAIRHSYWIHTEFNFTSDIQDYKSKMSLKERSAIRNTMLAISQIEVAVKNFWGSLYDKMPKPEIGAVGATFSESEVRHHDAYSHLLEILGLNKEFENIGNIPALKQRVDYLEDAMKNSKSSSNEEFAESILLFALFIEHVSLFSQFLIIMSFNKFNQTFKGISNVVEATSKEEQIHGDFGIDLIKVIKDENPGWFNEERINKVKRLCREALYSEMIVIDWIFENGELDFLPKDTVKEFIKNRFNNSLESIGIEKIFDIDEDLIKDTDWFDDEIIGTKHGDFFVKRSINYSKRTKSITGDDLF